MLFVILFYIQKRFNSDLVHVVSRKDSETSYLMCITYYKRYVKKIIYIQLDPLVTFLINFSSNFVCRFRWIDHIYILYSTFTVFPLLFSLANLIIYFIFILERYHCQNLGSNESLRLYFTPKEYPVTSEVNVLKDVTYSVTIL